MVWDLEFLNMSLNTGIFIIVPMRKKLTVSCPGVMVPVAVRAYSIL